MPFEVAETGDACERARRFFGSCGTEPLSPVVDDATLRELVKLDEHQLHDIGVYRKARYERWLWIAPIIEFDYFHRPHRDA